MLFDPMACGECVRDAGERGVSYDEIIAMVRVAHYPPVAITHESSGLFTCDKGHRTVLVFQEGAYALLFERALQRVAVGASRDAVLDAYTALEMYLGTVPERVRFESTPKADLPLIREELREAVRTSERTIGAAFAALSIRTKSAPPKIPSRLSELRNKATHAGEHPSDADAEWSALEVERLIQFCANALASSAPPVDPACPRYVDVVFSLAHRAQREKHPDVRRTSVSVVTVFDALQPERQRTSAAERIDAYRRGENFLRFA